MAAPTSTVDTVVSLCKRRGFVFPCGEIYGGTRSAWDYGPLGVELKENIKRQWWKSVVTGREDVVGLDSSIILPRQTWVASGHVGEFSDPLTECQSCHKRFRVDHMQEAIADKEAEKGKEIDPDDIPLSDIACPNCGTRGAWTEPREFNMMLKTHLGVIEDESGLHYLRPETAQGIFINFLKVMNASRKKPPFGIAQTGKSFRNEITPGNFIFRTREFEQMEMEFFVKPGEDEEWHQYWIDERTRWYTDLGINPDNLRHFEHPLDKLSHYSSAPSTSSTASASSGSEWGELEGIANRTDFDLTTHTKHSGTGPGLLRPVERREVHPVRHRAGGGLSALAADVPRRRLLRGRGAQHQGRGRQARRAAARQATQRRSRRQCCPWRNADLTPKARGLAATLRKHWNIEFDDAGAIGSRYRRQDEIGTPFCVTVDFDTLEDHAVTVRERDTMHQERVSLDQIESYLAARLLGC